MRAEHEIAIGADHQITETTRQRDTRHILARVAVGLKVVMFAPAALGVANGIHIGAYSSGWPAVLSYTILVGWSAVFVLVTLRHGVVPQRVALADVAVTAGCLIMVAVAVHPWFFVKVSNSDLEPAMVVTAVVVAMTCSPRQAVIGWAVLAAAHATAEIPAMIADHGNIVDTASDLCWLGGATFVGGLITRRLLAADADVDTATRQVVTIREQMAEERGRAEERIRHYRLLHDGPLSFVTALASGGLDHLGLAGVKQQCAIKVDQWRGLSSEHSPSAISDLTLALTEVGDEFAVYRLQVVYQFGDLPADLPADVVKALSGASREAFNNIVVHANVDHAVLTAVTITGSGGKAVIVTVVDQGKGFDPATMPPDRGLARSIIYRMHEVGGTGTVASHPGEGTAIELRWPR